MAKSASQPAPQADDATRLTDRKRAAILDAAIAEFRAHGFEVTSMDRIAATAEVSKRTVYNHFPSKEALFAEILMHLWRASLAGIDLAYRRDRPLDEQLSELLRQKLRMLSDVHHLDLARVAIAAVIHSPERAQDMVARLGDKEEAITAWVRAAMQDGRLKKADPIFAAHQLQGLVKSFAFWPQIVMGQATLSKGEQDKLVKATVEMFLGYYAK
jgi:TetR/AcrR family transcriptional regulator of autoinduction and epiphytic fitness